MTIGVENIIGILALEDERRTDNEVLGVFFSSPLLLSIHSLTESTYSHFVQLPKTYGY
jgi:hypothetical protein